MTKPFQPAVAAAPHFDAARNVWTLSRYMDVYAALREPALCQATTKTEQASPDGSEQLHTAVQADIARMSTELWRTKMEQVMDILIQRAKRRKKVDVVRHILHPWVTSMMLILCETDDRCARRLMWISAQLFYGPAVGWGADTYVRKLLRRGSAWRTRRAAAELDSMLASGRLVLSKSMFAGLTQTLASFMAKAWLALLENPEQMAMMMGAPESTAGAMEELLRYAGVVHTFYRRAEKDLRLGEIDIVKGQLVVLKMDSANFDADRFEQPGLLDITRRTTGHLGLGTGLHACSGAFLVRLACSVATPIFLDARPRLERERDVRWAGDSSLLWPISIAIKFPEM